LKLNVIILLLFCVFGFFGLNAQSYNYSYTDPCTGNLKTIIVPINGNVTVAYYGEVGNFSYNDFTNGTFDAWTNNIFAQYGTNSPCSEIVGLGTAINVTQSSALNVIGILNSLSSISDLASGSTNILGGAVSSINSGGSNGNSGNNNKKGNNSQNGSGGNTTNTNNTTTNNNQNQTNGTSNTNEGSTTTSGTNETSPNGGNGTSNQNVGTQNPTQAGGASTQSGTNENGNTPTSTTVNGGGNGSGSNANGTNGQTSGSQNQTSETQTSETPTNGGTTETNGNGETSETQINNQTTTENGSNGNNGGGGTTGQSGNNGGNGNGSGNNETQEEPTTTEGTEGEGKTNITAGASTTVKSTPTSKEGGKPTVVASADFVGFNFKNSDVKVGAKATGGYTALRWDGKRSYGVLGDYTSALKGPNITSFYAWVKPKSIILTSATITIGFEGNRSLYGTIAAGQMFTFQKLKSLKLLYMGTVSYGSVYRESFLGTALIGGAMYDMKIGKRFDIKLMNLLVYAPYVSYYNDVVLKSPYVMLPSIGTNIRITKKFKFNINAGGAWDLKTSALNYTVTCGTRMIVGQ
jgi:hypothetical protein